MKAFLIGMVIFVVLLIGGFGMSYVSAVNTGARFEADIEKFDKSSQNTLSNYTLKLKEAAKVPEKYVGSLEEIIQATFEGRYGEDGSQATFQWIQENNIPVDASVYTKLQQIIDAGREEFKLSQDRKLESCAQYEFTRNTFWKGMWLGVAGYPKKDIDKLCRIIVDSSTGEKFSTGVDSEIKF
ncbi:TPA: hypothetical protein ACOAY7_002947 [Vibrio cholerae]|nr:hypothetical protein 2017DRC106_0190 [Vibrio phage ICP1]QVV97667.1 hypothetical protein 2017DRC32_0190 [Vibrio phage ICP1]QVV97894.1 hypothetical protein 2017DRC48_0190 [Vibrio phage ICP1]QVV98121.1 hypothetical protein 2017DRC55_0190 [Vibrio phage ICP1]QVV98347.1 hypothetical protein 2017DRC72_0185 [Vibrio phage ICP1]